MMADMDLSIARLTELKQLGVLIAIDDFGTGYSSLNYVRRFPVDILKVDKSFIDGVSEDGESSALTAAVIELAGILNLKPVAEGIERVDQLERLLELHCALGQGFYFAKPLETGQPREPARRAAHDGGRGRPPPQRLTRPLRPSDGRRARGRARAACSRGSGRRPSRRSSSPARRCCRS